MGGIAANCFEREFTPRRYRAQIRLRVCSCCVGPPSLQTRDCCVAVLEPTVVPLILEPTANILRGVRRAPHSTPPAQSLIRARQAKKYLSASLRNITVLVQNITDLVELPPPAESLVRASTGKKRPVCFTTKHTCFGPKHT